MRVYVTTCDSYLVALRPFAYLFNKYWGEDQEVVVGGFSHPDFNLPKNFKFHSIGKQEDYPINKWSNALYKMMNDLGDEIFVLMLEDYWITRQVDRKAINILYSYMVQYKDVIKIDLCTDRLYAHGADLKYDTVAYLDLIKSMPGSPYHMSLMTGMWRAENMKKVLIPNESPWDVELVGTTRLSHLSELRVMGTKQSPVKHTLAFRGGTSSNLLLDDIKPADVSEMHRLGLLNFGRES